MQSILLMSNLDKKIRLALWLKFESFGYQVRFKKENAYSHGLHACHVMHA